MAASTRNGFVLAPHRRAISIAETAVTTRVEELRRYAREVGAADAALSDWRAQSRDVAVTLRAGELLTRIDAVARLPIADCS